MSTRLGNEPSLTEQALSSAWLENPLTEQEIRSVRVSLARLGSESSDPIRQSSRVANILFPGGSNIIDCMLHTRFMKFHPSHPGFLIIFFFIFIFDLRTC